MIKNLSRDAKIVAFVADFVGNAVFQALQRGVRPSVEAVTDAAKMFQSETGCDDVAKEVFRDYLLGTVNRMVDDQYEVEVPLGELVYNPRTREFEEGISRS